MITVLLVVLVATAQSQAESDQTGCGKNVEAWLRCNNPRVSAYLSKLGANDVGRVLGGVKLSDGSVALRDYRFRGRARALPSSAHVFLVERGGKHKAFAWVDEGGEPLPLPKCGGAMPASTYVLSGDVYTWKALQPGHGVVETACLDEGWTAIDRK